MHQAACKAFANVLTFVAARCVGLSIVNAKIWNIPLLFIQKIFQSLVTELFITKTHSIMKKFFVLPALLILCIVAIYFSSCNNSKTEPEASITSNKDSLDKVLKRGEYLTLHVAMCVDCHGKRDFSKYSGPVVPGSEGGGGEEFGQKLGVPGVVYARNITPDAETGIGTWADDDIMKAITQGISKNGDTLYPIMPYYNLNHMAKEDLQSIIAYIRTLKPIKNKIPARHLMAPTMAFYNPKFLQPTVDGNVRPPESDRVKYGEYMVTLADCGTCHTPMTPQGPDMSRPFAGSFLFDAGSFKVNSANITSDSATGIGTWTEERFLNKFTAYREEKSFNFNPGKQNSFMPISAYAGMKDDDLKAIYAYLHTVRPITNKVEKYPK
jgi:mono/diheme cytochrome c family protein